MVKDIFFKAITESFQNMYQIDDQIRELELTFFDLTYQDLFFA